LWVEFVQEKREGVVGGTVGSPTKVEMLFLSWTFGTKQSTYQYQNQPQNVSHLLSIPDPSIRNAFYQGNPSNTSLSSLHQCRYALRSLAPCHDGSQESSRVSSFAGYRVSLLPSKGPHRRSLFDEEDSEQDVQAESEDRTQRAVSSLRRDGKIPEADRADGW